MCSPNSLNLREFVRETGRRQEFLAGWAATGIPRHFRLSAILRPQALLAAILQVEAHLKVKDKIAFLLKGTVAWDGFLS